MSETTTAPASADAPAAAPDAPDIDHVLQEHVEANPEPEAAAPDAPAEAPQDARAAQQLRAELGRLREMRQRDAQEIQKAREDAERHRMAALRVLEAQRGPAQAQQPAADAIPDVNVDPVGHFQAKTRILEAQLAQVAQPVVQQQQAAQFHAAVAAAEREFASRVPDYQEALPAARKAFAALGEALGATPQDVAVQIANFAISAGRSPAEVAYTLARTLGGYGGKAEAPAPAAQPAQVMDALQRGAQAAQTVGGGGGGQRPAALTIETISRADAHQYAQLVKKYGQDAIEAAFRAAG